MEIVGFVIGIIGIGIGIYFGLKGLPKKRLEEFEKKFHEETDKVSSEIMNGAIKIGELTPTLKVKRFDEYEYILNKLLHGIVRTEFQRQSKISFWQGFSLGSFFFILGVVVTLLLS